MHPGHPSARRHPSAALLLLTASAVHAELSFEDVSEATGFTPAMAADIPAGGVAVADFDGNGWPDIFVTGYFHANRLYFNNGDGTFSDDSDINAQLAGLQCSVTAAADYDNDGWPDLYVGCRGDDNHLFRNVGGAGFIDVTTPELRHNPGTTHGARTDAVAWGDIDGNGRLDLFIGVYPHSSNPDPDDPDARDRIVLNLGNGQWRDITAPLPGEALTRTALAATFTDIDRDGDADLYVVNDKLDGNVLWRNDGPGCDGWCLRDIAKASGADRPVYGMGIAVGDYDRDGLDDLLFSSIGEQVLLRMIARDPPRFEQAQDSAGVNYFGVGWATIFADFDHDGFEDAYLAVSLVPGNPGQRVDRLYLNNADGSFSDVVAGSGLDMALSSQCAARLDYDGDGRLDLVIGHFGSGYRLYRNTTPETGNYIAFRLAGGAGINRDAAGARVEITTADGRQSRELRLGASRGSSHQPLLHFGLDTAEAAEVSVHWPGGGVQAFGSLDAGEVHTLVQDPGVMFADSFETAR